MSYKNHLTPSSALANFHKKKAKDADSFSQMASYNYEDEMPDEMKDDDTMNEREVNVNINVSNLSGRKKLQKTINSTI